MINLKDDEKNFNLITKMNKIFIILSSMTVIAVYIYTPQIDEFQVFLGGVNLNEGCILNTNTVIHIIHF